jgi:hypothetical protein
MMESGWNWFRTCAAFGFSMGNVETAGSAFGCVAYLRVRCLRIMNRKKTVVAHF